MKTGKNTQNMHKVFQYSKYSENFTSIISLLLNFNDMVWTAMVTVSFPHLQCQIGGLAESSNPHTSFLGKRLQGYLWISWIIEQQFLENLEL